jgi:hypothetical protein
LSASSDDRSATARIRAALGDEVGV